MKTKININNPYKIIILGITLLITLNCGTIKDAYNCNDICNRYEECFDSDYDSSSCTSECRDKAKDTDDFSEQAEECQACIDNQSCSESFDCIDECIAIIP